MQAKERHQAILDLITDQAISRQDELADLLGKQGFSVTQASVSRDLDRLGVIKINGRYVHQVPRSHGPYGRVSLAASGQNLIVVRCGSGLASAAAVHIDSASIPEIVGTIAGDDTIFVAVKGEREQMRAIKSMKLILETSERNGNN
jgi:transcriptional regulator of arginine metabolism